MTVVRIPGIVKAFRCVRSQLQAGVLPEEVDAMRNYVEELVSQIELLCFESGYTPEHLPTPSRNAFRYLKQIDLSNLPIRSGDAAGQTPARPLRIPNVVKQGNQIAVHLWQRREHLLARPERRRTMLAQIAHYANAIERAAEQCDATPAALEKPSRQVYCWFRFLSQPEHLDAHIDALCLAGRKAEPFLEETGIGLEMSMMYLHSLWRGRTRHGVMRLKMSQGFLYAPDEIWEAIFASIFSGESEQRTIVSEFLESEEYSSVLFELQSFVEDASQAKGIVYDLEESFDRVNAAYFDPELTPCKLHWSHTPTTSKFGHYQSEADAIMLSSSLDHVDVPAFVVDFVMYHEMLHKLHGFEFVDGRRIAHTPAFRADEQKFDRYEEAEAFLQMWAEQCA